jgi:hypothetical protein
MKLRFAATLLIIVTTGLLAQPVKAQLSFPRLGISASAEAYVDTLTVAEGQEFTLYACAFGVEPGLPLEQDVSVLQWVIHQACCGASLVVLDTQFNPELTHIGDPYQGVISSSEICVSADSILLATLTCVMEAPEPGNYLAAAGPFGPAQDCEGGNPLFMDMPLSIRVTEDSAPVEASTWDGLKAFYR